MNILVVEDRPLMRLGIQKILEEENHKVYFGSLLQDGGVTFDCPVLDFQILHLPQKTKEEEERISRFIYQGKQRYPNLKTLGILEEGRNFFLWNGEEHNIEGFLLSKDQPEDLKYGLSLMHRGHDFISPELLSEINTTRKKENNKAKKEECLTEREREVFHLLQKGKTNGQIAEELFISNATVKKHVSNVLGKLNLSHRVEAALYVKEGEDCEL